MTGYTYIAVAGQDTIGLNATNNTLTIATSSGLSISTNPLTNTLTLNTETSYTESLNIISTLSDLTVTNTLNINPTNTGTIDNVVIGGLVPRNGTFSQLTALSTVTLNPANATVTISPTGTGTVTINPAITGSINNVAIGATTPAAASVTTLTATNNVLFNGNNATITISPTGTGTVTINPAITGSINNVAIGATTPASGKFTAVQITSPPGGATSAVTIGYAAALAAAYGMIMS
jgi:hypothetical protein